MHVTGLVLQAMIAILVQTLFHCMSLVLDAVHVQVFDKFGVLYTTSCCVIVFDSSCIVTNVINWEFTSFDYFSVYAINDYLSMCHCRIFVVLVSCYPYYMLHACLDVVTGHGMDGIALVF